MGKEEEPETDAKPVGVPRRFRKIATEEFWQNPQVKHVQQRFAMKYEPDEDAKKSSEFGKKMRKQNWIQNSVVQFYIDLIDKEDSELPPIVKTLHERACELEDAAIEAKERALKEDKPMGLYRR